MNDRNKMKVVLPQLTQDVFLSIDYMRMVQEWANLDGLVDKYDKEQVQMALSDLMDINVLLAYLIDKYLAGNTAAKRPSHDQS